MIDILEAVAENRKEAVKLLQGVEGHRIDLALWDEEKEEYVPNGEDGTNECYIRYANGDGEIFTRLVVSVRDNDEKKCIEILDTEGIYTETDGNWYPLTWADDISEWQVYDAIGYYFE